MTTFENVDDLGQQLIGLRLIETQEWDECLAELDPRRHQPEHLLRLLVKKARLTSYQGAKALKGEAESLVIGKYKLMYRNASGSFARVFRACTIPEGETIGMKLLRQRWSDDEKAVAQFHREAHLCKPMRHRNIVPIYDVGSDNGHHFFTMEFIEGGNLRDFIKIRENIEVAEATRFALDISAGLQYALSHGITHRDLKLTNVLISSDGVAKLADFGLAGHERSQAKRDSKRIERAVEYASLEKGTGVKPNDPRSDLYFLGAIYYELIAGSPPYPPTVKGSERRRFTRYSTVPPIRTVNPHLPDNVANIASKLMAIDPRERYQTPSEVVEELRRVSTELGESARSGEKAAETATTQEPAQGTVMFVESRAKQQDMLREYLAKQGYRVLVLGDMKRGISRITNNPPDCLVLMGESIGERVVHGYEDAVRLGRGASVAIILVLSEEQAKWKRTLDESKTARVLTQPITLKDLHREIQLALEAPKIEKT